MKPALKYMFHWGLSSFLARSKVYILNLNTSPIKFFFLNKVLVSRFIWQFIISFCFPKMPEECIVIKQKWKYKNKIFNINPILHFKEVKLKILSYLYISLVKDLFYSSDADCKWQQTLYIPLFYITEQNCLVRKIFPSIKIIWKIEK